MEAIESWFSEPLESRIGLIVKIQSYESKLLYAAASVASFLSDEEFYVPLLLVLHWAVSSEICMHIALLMSVGFVIGNMLKNLFCIPRPPSTQVRRARASDADDYSMPSTHSLQAVSLPLWFTVYLVKDLGYGSPLFWALWIPALLVWTGSISLSRLYLGAHTIQDIVAGWVLGIMISVPYCLVYKKWERDLLDGDERLALLLFAASLALVYLHPMEVFVYSKLSKWSIIVSQSGYLTSCDLAGVIGGVALGLITTPKNVPISVMERPGAALFRFTVGPICCIAAYMATKKLLREVLLVGYNAVGIPMFDPPAKILQIPPTLLNKKDNGTVALESLNVHTFNNGPAPTFRRWTQETFGLLLFGSGFQIMPIVKYLQYMTLTIMVTTLCPVLFQYVGL